MNYMVSLNELGRIPPSNAQPELSLVGIFADSMGAELWLCIWGQNVTHCIHQLALVCIALYQVGGRWGEGTD